jgi:small-conductance mechanosensitive channel
MLPLIPVLRLAIVVLAIAMIVPLIMKPTSQNLFFLLGTFAVAIGFAFKDYVSSLIAGVIAVFEKPYRVGDRVRIDDLYGEVRLIGFRAVKIVTPDDTAVIIPHSKIWNSSIQNANDGQLELLCVAEFYLHPEHDANAVRDRLLDIARTSPYVARERPIDVIISEKPWYTQYRLKAYVIDGRDEFQYITDMTIRGKQLFADMGVRPASLPLPVHMKNGAI